MFERVIGGKCKRRGGLVNGVQVFIDGMGIEAYAAEGYGSVIFWEELDSATRREILETLTQLEQGGRRIAVPTGSDKEWGALRQIEIEAEQASAWEVVFDHCLKLGMKLEKPTGLDNVLAFIDKMHQENRGLRAVAEAAKMLRALHVFDEKTNVHGLDENMEHIDAEETLFAAVDALEEAKSGE